MTDDEKKEILVPEPSGYPIAQLQLADFDGVYLNVAAPTDDDLRALAVQLADFLSDPVQLFLSLRDPMFGAPMFLTRAGAERVVQIGRAYAEKVDRRAMRPFDNVDIAGMIAPRIPRRR